MKKKLGIAFASWGVFVGASFTGPLSASAMERAVANETLCLTQDLSESHRCLSQTLLPQLVEQMETAYQGELDRLLQAYDLEVSEDRWSFQKLIYPQGKRALIQIVSERLDGTAAPFDLKLRSFNRMKQRADAQRLAGNLREAVKFLAYYKARSFGSTNSKVFAFNRVEVTSSRADNEQGLMYLDSGILKINLPQDESLEARDFIEYWNSGKVLLTKNQAHLPQGLLVYFGKKGNMKESIGARVLENWSVLNPISDLRVTLTATYLKYAEKLKQKIAAGELEWPFQKSNLQDSAAVHFQPVAFKLDNQQLGQKVIEVIDSPEAYAKALDSLFAIRASSENRSSDGSGSGKINVINRKTGMCFVKVSNSHVIDINWRESSFGPLEKAEPVQITIEEDKVDLKANSKQDIHVVNDKTAVGFVCVDTNDNVQVDLNGLMSTVMGSFNEDSLLLMALRQLGLLK